MLLDWHQENLKGKSDLGFYYSNGVVGDMIGYTDLDWANDLDDRNSVSGYLSSVGAPISWRSKKRTSVLCVRQKLNMLLSPLPPQRQFG